MNKSSVFQACRTAVSFLRGRTRVRHMATAPLPTEYGPFHIHVYEHAASGQTHVALVRGDLKDGHNVLARLHSSCLTGDIFHSARCDCGPQLDSAMQRIASEGQGVLVYLNQEGRGIGLANKILAYGLQDEGYDTVEANERLGFAADGRDYRLGAEILRDLGVQSIRLLSNNPQKQAGIEAHGLIVTELLPLEIPASDHSRRYLMTKKHKMGHLLASV
jgi:3,4-dihydroxy 2-butanone 4-phosphate synthase / GTP cyclohydrolase II